MKPAESFIGQPVRSLQTMLRTIAKISPSQKSVVPDGIYSRQTQDAVAVFQRRTGLPASGMADGPTWNAIAAEYIRARVETEPAQPLLLHLKAGCPLGPGSEHSCIRVVQAVLFTISRSCDAIPQPDDTGILDDQTQKSLTAFQIFSGLPPTGVLDKRTWKNLALQYSRIVGQEEW